MLFLKILMILNNFQYDCKLQLYNLKNLQFIYDLYPHHKFNNSYVMILNDIQVIV